MKYLIVLEDLLAYLITMEITAHAQIKNNPKTATVINLIDIAFLIDYDALTTNTNVYTPYQEIEIFSTHSTNCTNQYTIISATTSADKTNFYPNSVLVLIIQCYLPKVFINDDNKQHQNNFSYNEKHFDQIYLDRRQL